MAFNSTIATISEIAEDLQISEIIEYYGGAEKIADQYESWQDRIQSLTGCDDVNDLYLIADRSGCPIFNYVATRLGSGMGFWESYRWECSDVLYREAIADGRLI